MDLSTLPPLSRHSTEALHWQVYQILLEQILAGKCAPEEKLPGMNLLAETFHVSAITISQALDQLIHDGYCFRRPKKGTFVASSNRRTNSPEPGTILLFSSHHDSEINLVDTPFYTGLRRSAEQTPQTNLLIIAGKHAPDQLAVQLKERERILGVILIAVENLSFALKLARSYPTLPFVLLNYQFAGFEQLAPSNLRGVFNDEFCGGYMAASRLFADGAKNIGILQYQVDDENYHLRVRGARQAHVDHGIPFRDSRLLSVNAKIQPEERGYNGMAELIARNPHLDAVFCVNDILASGAMRYLTLTRNIRNIRIIGFDNHIPELHIANHFPTVAIHSSAMSSAAIRMIRNPGEYPCRQLLIAPRIVYG